MDIVDKLSALQDNLAKFSHRSICREAADEIEQLRKRLVKREKLVEILRTLLDKGATIEEFQAAVKDVTG